jgi:peptidoglycan/LPS O-acetylase OafA/YrhL
MRINAFDYFRGIAIILIVAGHAIPNSGWNPASFSAGVLAWFLRDNSALFVFISGFFFHYIYQGRMTYTDFLKKKAVNVLIPYLVLSLSFISFTLLVDNRYPNFQDIQPDLYGNLYLLADHLLNGKAFVPYWYIPFIYLMFVLSPAFNAFIKLRLALQSAVMAGFFVISMLVKRPLDFDIFLTLVYFLPFYLLGIQFSQYKDTFLGFLKNYNLLIVTALLVVLSVQDYVILNQLNILDLRVVQKILLIFAFVALLDKFENSQLRFLRFAAASSFAVYFLHPLVFEILHRQKVISFLSGHGIFTFFIVFVITVAASIGLAMLIKSVLKNKSKYLMGW